MAAGIDGSWTASMEMKGRTAADSTGKRNVELTLDLKGEGEKLTGTVTARAGRRSMTIEDGRIDGDKFSFTTVQKSKQGDNIITWSGTVNGDKLEGTRGRQGGKRTVGFTAARKI